MYLLQEFTQFIRHHLCVRAQTKLDPRLLCLCHHLHRLLRSKRPVFLCYQGYKAEQLHVGGGVRPASGRGHGLEERGHVIPGLAKVCAVEANGRDDYVIGKRVELVMD